MEGPLRGRVPAGTRLIETFGWTPDAGFTRLDMHLARMATSARHMGYDFDAAAARACLKVQGLAPLRCRLTLGANGFEFTSAAMGENPAHWVLDFAPQRLHSENVWLQHKTTQRDLYDSARANLPQGVDEVLFLNEKDELCEGTITNLFVTLPDGQMVTPPLTCGLLPGILRQELLATGEIVETLVTRDMLDTADAIHMGNSLRGLIPATLR